MTQPNVEEDKPRSYRSPLSDPDSAQFEIVTFPPDYEDGVGFSDEEIDLLLSGAVSPTGQLGLVAAAQKHNGSMIALIPTEDDLDRLVTEYGEPYEDLHLTLMYLGDAAKIVPARRMELIDAMRRVADMNPIIDASGFGIAIWNPGDDEEDTAVVLDVGGDELEPIFKRVRSHVDRIFDGDTPEQHEPWRPHVCLMYTDDTAILEGLKDRVGPIRFDRIRVAFSGEITDFELYNGEDTSYLSSDDALVAHVVHNQKTHGNRTDKITSETNSWGPFRYPVKTSIQEDYGYLARESNEEYAANKNYVRETIPVKWLIPTQNATTGDEQDGGGDGDPFVIVLGNDYYLVDGHHRAAAAGVDGKIKAWVTYPGELTASGETFTKERDVNVPGGGHNLRNHWVRGEGAVKIRWNTPGDFTRCVTQLSDKVKNPQGLCAEYHKAATGMWPGDKRNPGMSVEDTVFENTDDCGCDEEVIIADGADEYDGSWTGVLAIEDRQTGDQRMFSPGVLTWVDPTNVVAPLQWARENNGEHKGSVTAGRIHKIWRDPLDARIIRGSGKFNLNDEDGLRAFHQVKDGFLSGISIDPDQITDAKTELIYPTALSENPIQQLTIKPELTVYHSGRIRGATLVPFPAFIEGKIMLLKKGESDNSTALTAAVDTQWMPMEYELSLPMEMSRAFAGQAYAFVSDGDADDPVTRSDCRFMHHQVSSDGDVGPAVLTACVSAVEMINSGRHNGLTYEQKFAVYQHLAGHIEAAGQTPPAFALESVAEAVVACGNTVAPPVEWFKDPGLTAATPFTVTDDGRVFGHAAQWGTCHTSFASSCVSPPTEPDYSFFETGEVLCADGSRVPVGQITLGTSHAPTYGVTPNQAVDHYGDTGTAVADVRVGADDHGIWVAGAVRPGVDPNTLYALRASALSGDWRRLGGQLRMVALLAVNVPGFAIPRTATTLEGERQLSLVAAGVVRPEDEEIRKKREYAATVEALQARLGLDVKSQVLALQHRVQRNAIIAALTARVHAN